MVAFGRWLAAGLFAAIVCACSSSPATHAPSPVASVQPPTTLERLPTSQRVVALVFDLGDDEGRTADVLDVLRRENVRAAFVVGGYWAEQHHDLLLAMTAAGHQIINGTYHGTSFTGASTRAQPLAAAERTLELSRTEVTVYHLTQRSTRPYWRPPFGDLDASAQKDAAAAGYPIAVTPSYDSARLDATNADAVSARAVAAAEPGAILLLHAASASPDADALSSIIMGLHAAGYEFVTIADVTAP
jgi:peptidoglycan/xylan/chitin deacetylase (PgdA/CDA1 family)